MVIIFNRLLQFASINLDILGLELSNVWLGELTVCILNNYPDIITDLTRLMHGIDDSRLPLFKYRLIRFDIFQV